MFLRAIGNQLIVAASALLVVLWTACGAQAALVCFESELTTHDALSEDLATALDSDPADWLQLDPVQQAMDSTSCGSVTDAAREKEEAKLLALRRFEQLYGPALHQTGDMTSSPTNAQLTSPGSPSGITAIATDTPLVPQAALQATLSPEKRMILPTGLPYELFRPPRAA